MRSLGGETGGRITTRGSCRSNRICTCSHAQKKWQKWTGFSFWYWTVSPVFAGTGPRVPPGTKNSYGILHLSSQRTACSTVHVFDPLPASFLELRPSFRIRSSTDCALTRFTRPRVRVPRNPATNRETCVSHSPARMDTHAGHPRPLSSASEQHRSTAPWEEEARG